MTFEELISEEKKIKSQKRITAFIIGAFIGIAFYSATHKGVFLTFILLIVAFFIGKRSSSNFKNIEDEIKRRNEAK